MDRRYFSERVEKAGISQLIKAERPD